MSIIKQDYGEISGETTSIRDWDYHYYSSASSTITENIGYEPKKAVFIFGTTTASQRFTRMYDANIDKNTLVSYLSNGNKEIENMNASAVKITNNGFTIIPPSGYTYSLIVVLTSPD